LHEPGSPGSTPLVWRGPLRARGAGLLAFQALPLSGLRYAGGV